MFQQMVADLKSGRFPESNLLRQRLAAALVKKLAVIKTPCAFWSADEKINPAAKHLLWAAILLQDEENCRLIEGIIAAELEERQRARGRRENAESLGAMVKQQLQSYLHELLELPPDRSLRQNLMTAVAKCFPGRLDAETGS